MNLRLHLALLLTLSACAAGAPPGFSSGDSWAVPLVGPLEDGALVVPVSINGKGPYLFMIDPDAPMSSIDEMLVGELDLYSKISPHERADESDTMRVIRTAEVPRVQIGNLSVRGHIWWVHKPGAFWFSGRLVRGLLGKDIIADSLILTVDRDRGMLYLATQGHADPPASGTKITGKHLYGRFVVNATINKSKAVKLHLDVGGLWSRLWPHVMKEAHLPTVQIRTTLFDEFGTPREVSSGAMAAKLELGGAEQSGLMMLPFADKRLRKHQLDGAVGQNYLSNYRVTVNWHKKAVWLGERDRDYGAKAAERIRRWGPEIDKCATPACVTIELTRPAPEPAPAPEPEPAPAPAPAPPAEGEPAEGAPVPPAEPPAPAPEPEPVPAPVASATGIVITREDWTLDKSFDVVIEALNESGQPFGLPLLRITFEAGGQPSVTLDAGAEAYLQAASFRVVDWSPFPRECEKRDAGAPMCTWAIRKHR